MYENELHLYNGLEKVPDPKLIAEAVLGAFLGFAVGATLCYSFEFHPRGSLKGMETYFRGGGPEKLKPGELNQNTRQTFNVLAKLLDNPKGFGKKAMEVLGLSGEVDQAMEESFKCMTLYQTANSEDVLGLILGPVVMGYPQKSLTVSRLVQNHPLTDAVVWDFHMVMREALVHGRALHSPDLYGGQPVKLMEPDGKVTTTFNNAVVRTYQGLPFDRTMALICNDGGHTTMTGAISGALIGAIRGVKNIPHTKQLRDVEWITRLATAAARQITGF